MKKLIIPFLLLPLFLFAQEQKPNLLAIDFFYAPEINREINGAYEKQFEQESAFRKGINIVVGFHGNRHFFARIGVNYATYNQIYERNYDSVVFRRQINYYEIPIAFRISGGKRKLHSYIEFITSLSFKSNYSELKPHYNVGFSYGIEYRIFNEFAIFAQPTLRIPIGNNTVYVYSLGLETGIKFRIPAI